jgi:ATP-dependent DNA ligase
MSQPMLARMADKLPGPQWSYAFKWDGYRCLAREARVTRHLAFRARATHGTNYPSVTAAVASIKAEHVDDDEPATD